MKKTLILLSSTLILSVTSCKKDRVCECTNTASEGSSSTSTTTIKKIKKSEAKNLCQKMTYTSTSNSGFTSTSINDCKLK